MGRPDPEKLNYENCSQRAPIKIDFRNEAGSFAAVLRCRTWTRSLRIFPTFSASPCAKISPVIQKFLSTGTLPLLGVAVVGIALVGCKTGPTQALGGLLEQRTITKTNAVEVPVVSRGEAVSTDASGATVTNVVNVTNLVTRTFVSTNIVWQPSQALNETLETVNFLAPVIPPPYGTAVTFGAGIASVLLGFAARRKNKENESLSQQIAAVVTGVEEAAKALPEGSKVKEVIRDNALKLGIATDLHETVKKLT